MYDAKGRGDSGGMSMALTPNEKENKVDIENDARPKVGSAMRVGSIYARTMQEQDWWQTTIIKEILEESENYVKFKTLSGSIYEWKIV
jgi:hypothetical protein